MQRERVARILRAAGRRGRAAFDALRGRPTPSATLSGADDPEAWWNLLPFTAHRIALAPGVETTIDGVPPADDIRTRLVIEACGGSLDGRTVVDLGCLEGGFTLAFAQGGAARALGIEARELSVRRAELARTVLDVSNAQFVVADIKDELGAHEPFDVVFATGILYHVADPAAFLATMRAACRHVALVDTHVADPDAASHGCSPMTTRTFAESTYRGRIFPEYPPDVTDQAKEAMLWAAYSDADAFWPVEDDLVAMIREAGFERVEKVDPSTGRLDGPWGVDQVNRVMYLAYV